MSNTMEIRIGPRLAVHRRGDTLTVIGRTEDMSEWLGGMHTIASHMGYVSADERTLIDFFRHDRPDEGWMGDEHGEQPGECAIRVMRQQSKRIRDLIERAERSERAVNAAINHLVQRGSPADVKGALAALTMARDNPGIFDRAYFMGSPPTKYDRLTGL
jgi:hypothetical protein